jgi:hypothetical protein
LEKSPTPALGRINANSADSPNVVVAIGPDETTVVRLQCSAKTIRRLEDGRLNAKIGEYCGLVHGSVPGGTRGLMAAHALFRGIRRPRIDDGLDDDIYVYVMDHDRTFNYPVEDKYGGKGPTRRSSPLNSVFVAYVEYPEGWAVENPAGRILYWEWVLSDDVERLPRDYQSRYSERLWEKK